MPWEPSQSTAQLSVRYLLQHTPSAAFLCFFLSFQVSAAMERSAYHVPDQSGCHCTDLLKLCPAARLP